MNDVLVSAVVVAYNSADDLEVLLPRLVHPQVEVLVLDNASPQDDAAVAERQERVRVVRVGRNAGWPAASNLGAREASAPVLAFVNPDARPTADDLLRLAGRVAAGVACVSPVFVHPDGAPQPFMFRFPDAWSGLFTFLPAGKRIDRWCGRRHIRRRTYDFGRDVPTTVDQPGAACLVVGADTFEQVGPFDERMWLFFADTDWCLRARRSGLVAVVAEDVHVVHEGGGSVGHEQPLVLQEAFQRDYVVYARAHYSAAGRVLTVAGIWVLTGVLPAAASLVRGQAAAALECLRSARRVVQRAS